MSCEGDTVKVLRATGHRATPQRLMIVSALRHAAGHVTASQILETVREAYPYVDVSTVYRTLGVLKEMRLISETDLGSGEYSFEWLHQDRHHHLICRRCKQVTSLDHSHLEKLAAEVTADYGFKPDMDHFAIFGLCEACQASEGHGS